MEKNQEIMLGESLTLLLEVLDGPIPMTQALRRQIEAHLDEPHIRNFLAGLNG